MLSVFRKMLFKLLLLLLCTTTILAVIYPGQCPRKYSEKQLSCKHFLKNFTYLPPPPPQSFIPIFQLPTDNSTLNIFYNPFPDKQRHCIRIYLECYRGTPSLTLGCEKHRCVGHDLDLYFESTFFQTKFTHQDCAFITRQYEVVLRWVMDVGTGKDFLLIWGCRDVDIRRHGHEEGAWLLKAVETSEMTVKTAGLLQTAMKMLTKLGSSAVMSDFVHVASENASKGCQCGQCSDQKRCDKCLNDVFLLKNKRGGHDPITLRHHDDYGWLSYKNVIKRGPACDYEQLSVKLICLLHEIIKFLVT